MSDKIDMGDSKFDFNMFCRYIYGGFLLSVVEIIIFKDQARSLYEYLGKDAATVFLSSLATLAIGTGFYVAYKTIFSELFIDWIHINNPGFMLKHSIEKCAFAYFEKLTSKADVIVAFRLVRDSELFDKTISKMFYRRHTEVHVLYQTATIFLIGAISILFNIRTYNITIPLCLFACLCIIFYLCGFKADTNLCADENAYFHRLDEKEVKGILRKAKLLKETGTH